MARLLVTSNADNATESIYLVGNSTGEALGSVGGDVASLLSLSVGPAPSFGTFTPALARNYDTATTASVISTAGNAKLSVSDTSTTAPGHLVNGTFSLPRRCRSAPNNAANTGTAFTAAERDRRHAGRSAHLLGPDGGCGPRHAELPAGHRRD